jgi:hypothetical protein
MKDGVYVGADYETDMNDDGESSSEEEFNE